MTKREKRVINILKNMTRQKRIIKMKNYTKHGAWQLKRNKIIKRDKFCLYCGEDRNLTVHHLISPVIEPKLMFDDRNLITCCKICHYNKFHKR